MAELPKKKLKEAQKIALIKEISKRKHLCMDKFSANVTNAEKWKAWEEVWDYVKENGYPFANNEKGCKYIPQTWLYNLRKPLYVSQSIKSIN
jgi:hypothetical protein